MAFWQRVERMWIRLALLLLPVTSLPLLSRALGGTLVAPPGAFLLAVLGGWMLLLAFWQGRRWPLTGTLLAVFVSLALFSTGLAFFRPLLPYKQHTYSSEALQAVLTLALGVAVWLAAALSPRSRDDLQHWLRWINWAGVLLVAWGLLQAAIILLFDGQYPDWMVQLQRAVSIRDLTRSTFRKRVTAWAYEPSWLAHMLNVLFFPYWLAASLTGFSAWKHRLGIFSVENLLLAGGLLVLAFSFSRIGLLAFFLMAAFLTAVLLWRLSGLQKGWSRQRRLVAVAGGLLMLALLGLGGVWLLSFRDPRMARLFDLQAFDSVYELGRQLAIGERVVYWALGLQVFAAHPLLGVGLGGVGFYVPAELPAYGWRLTEIVEALTLRNFVFNAKNLWVRLLAESGLAGFTAFVLFMLATALDAAWLVQKNDRLYRTLGWMGTLVIVALLGEGVSLDSFAFPYFWVALGLVTAATQIAQDDAPGASGTAPDMSGA